MGMLIISSPMPLAQVSLKADFLMTRLNSGNKLKIEQVHFHWHSMKTYLFEL